MCCFSKFPRNVEEGCTLILLPLTFCSLLAGRSEVPWLCFSMFVAVPFRQGGGGGGIMDRLGFVFLSKDGPNVEEGREKLN